jgi:hypothetical protein
MLILLQQHSLTLRTYECSDTPDTGRYGGR